jgi:ABC-type Mn2+/Zn2+ transport system ATPase subunit
MRRPQPSRLARARRADSAPSQVTDGIACSLNIPSSQKGRGKQRKPPETADYLVTTSIPQRPAITETELRAIEILLEGSLDVVDAWDKRLSEGEKQRLSVARALLIRPDLLLLDEATNALDEMSEIALHRLIRERLSHTTIIAVSHSQALPDFYDRTIRIIRPKAM